MPEGTDPDNRGDAFDGPSKSELKRRMHALQRLGETLTGLSDKQLQQQSAALPGLAPFIAHPSIIER